MLGKAAGVSEGSAAHVYESMTTTSPELQKLLHAGVAAIRQGNKAAGVELLLKVVEQNDQIEAAWLWLSRAVDDPADQMTALENVLTINPKNVEAQQHLAQLRGAVVSVPPAEVPSSPVVASDVEPPSAARPPKAPPAGGDHWRNLLPHVALEKDDGIDDPLLCVYCGKLTQERDRHCPHCRQSLLVRVQLSTGSEYLSRALFLVGMSIWISLLEGLGPMLKYNAGMLANFELLVKAPGVKWFMGEFDKLTPNILLPLLGFYGARSVIFGLGFVGLNMRLPLAYYSMLVFCVIDVLLNIGLLLTGYLGPIACVLNMVLSAAAVFMLFSSDRDFPINEQRLLSQPDGKMRNAADFNRLGHYYYQRGMISLAVAQWRQAVGRAPREIAFYKDLGRGYAQLQRFERSLRVLTEAQKMAPEDASITELLKTVQERAAKQAKT